MEDNTPMSHGPMQIDCGRHIRQMPAYQKEGYRHPDTCIHETRFKQNFHLAVV